MAPFCRVLVTYDCNSPNRMAINKIQPAACATQRLLSVSAQTTRPTDGQTTRMRTGSWDSWAANGRVQSVHILCWQIWQIWQIWQNRQAWYDGMGPTTRSMPAIAGVQLTETMRNCSFRPWMHSWSLYSVRSVHIQNVFLTMSENSAASHVRPMSDFAIAMLPTMGGNYRWNPDPTKEILTEYISSKLSGKVFPSSSHYRLALLKPVPQSPPCYYWGEWGPFLVLRASPRCFEAAFIWHSFLLIHRCPSYHWWLGGVRRIPCRFVGDSGCCGPIDYSIFPCGGIRRLVVGSWNEKNDTNTANRRVFLLGIFVPLSSG